MFTLRRLSCATTNINYYPSPDPFADYGPLQKETVSQLRFLTNAGAALGLVLRQRDSQHQGRASPTSRRSSPKTTVSESSIPACSPAAQRLRRSAAECPGLVKTLAPYDLTAGGQTLPLLTATPTSRRLALYAEDTITKGPWSFNLGLRGDFYNGLDAVSRQPEPRAGVAYNIKKTNTVLRVSYARTMESPFNENLILSGTGCTDPVVSAIMTLAQRFACTTSPLTPGFRNEFHAGLQQAFGKYFVLSGEYIWKYTHNAYDFNVFGASPIYLPHRMAQFQDSRICRSRQRSEFSRFDGVCRDVPRRCALLPAHRQRNRASARVRRVPHRPRRSFRANHPHAIPAVQARPVVRVQLAV